MKENYGKFIIKENLRPFFRPTTNDHEFIPQCNWSGSISSFGQCSKLTPRVVLEFSYFISSMNATNEICCFCSWYSGVSPNCSENDLFNLSYLSLFGVWLSIIRTQMLKNSQVHWPKLNFPNPSIRFSKSMMESPLTGNSPLLKLFHGSLPFHVSTDENMWMNRQIEKHFHRTFKIN